MRGISALGCAVAMTLGLLGAAPAVEASPESAAASNPVSAAEVMAGLSTRAGRYPIPKWASWGIPVVDDEGNATIIYYQVDPGSYVNGEWIIPGAQILAIPGEAADIARAREEAHGLGLFIRSLVGLDREAASEAFGAFLADTTLTANQLNFVNLIVEELTQNGVMPAARLYESPFTDFAPTGPDMLFTDTQVDGIVTILDEVWRHAIADGETAA